MAGHAGQQPPVPAFADRLNHLFATVRAPSGREYTNAEAALATDVSATYIGYLRRGTRDNPSVETVRGLARFFGVRPSYLVDDEPDGDDTAKPQLYGRLAEALRNPAVSRLAMRAAQADLSPAAIDAIAAMIDEVEKLEQAAARRSGARKAGRPTGPDEGR
jgi:transcriptional regulator with XRE-family HTH domain